MSADRYDRQRRLAEVGVAGQERIRASEARIPAGPAAAVALAYLVRAGVDRARIERASSDASPLAGRFRFQAPEAVAAGAHLAVRHLVSALNQR